MRTQKETGQKMPYKVQLLSEGKSLSEAQKLSIERSREKKNNILKDNKIVRK